MEIKTWNYDDDLIGLIHGLNTFSKKLMENERLETIQD